MNNAPFDPGSNFGKWAIGYGALWVVLVMAVETGAGELAAALAVLIAGGMTVVAGDTVIKNLGMGGTA